MTKIIFNETRKLCKIGGEGGGVGLKPRMVVNGKT